jgi:hypothetical protein
MRLEDAKPGEVLQDANGEIWVRTARGAVCVFNPKDRDDMEASPGGRLEGAGVFSLESKECCGPFTRLVPESSND